MTLFVLIAVAAGLAASLCLALPMIRQRGQGGPVVGWIAGLGAAIPAAALGLYFLVGTPKALDGTENAGPEDLTNAIKKLESRLREAPDNLEGWVLLGRSRMALDQPARAADAFRRAQELAPDNATILVERAEAMAQAGDFRLTGEPAALIERALRLDPNHQKALWFGGLADWQAEDFAAAVEKWERLNGLLEPGSSVAESVERQLDQARRRAGMAPADEPVQDPAPAQASVDVSVSIADSLGDAVEPGDAVFVYARAAGGPPMPLAVKRLAARDLPATVTLSADDAMTEANRMQRGMALIVTARVSKSGTATPAPGDLQGESATITAGETDRVSIVIEQRVGAAESSD